MAPLTPPYVITVTIIPHLGASTEEAEITSSVMAAETMRKFLENGTIENSVNFPTATLTQRVRLCSQLRRDAVNFLNHDRTLRRVD